MKLLSKFLVITTLLFAFSFAANAQRGNRQPLNPEQMAENQTTQMVEKLSLDAVQTAKVKELNLTYAKKMHEAREDNKGNRDAMKEILASIDTEKKAELKQVLTEVQFKSYEEMQGKKKTRKRKKGNRQSK